LKKSTWQKAGDEWKSDMAANWETFKLDISDSYSGTRNNWAQGDYLTAIATAIYETPKALISGSFDFGELIGSSAMDSTGFLIDSIIPGLGFLA